jgi:hypothetical protein
MKMRIKATKMGLGTVVAKYTRTFFLSTVNLKKMCLDLEN